MKVSKEQRIRLTQMMQQEFIQLDVPRSRGEETPNQKSREHISGLRLHLGLWNRIMSWKRPALVQKTQAATTAE